MERPLLILCIDRDNDLYEKAGVSGPVIGRKGNIDAATKLALADPEDPDANAIFYAVKLYDQFKKENKPVEIATLSGHKSLGYTADRELSRQLDMVVRELRPKSCMFISDGVADEEIIPIIKSRIKIDSTKIIFIKQAKELEKTYFVLIEKLRDPHYAKIILGIPALLILALSLFSYFGFGWEPVGMLIGVYAILKLTGFESFTVNMLKDFRFSLERTSWIGYVAGFSILFIATIISYQSFITGKQHGLHGEKLAAYTVGSTVVILLIASLLIIIGKSMDALTEKRKFLITKYALYAVAVILATLVLKVGSDWVLNPSFEEAKMLGISFNPVSFGQFLFVLIVALVAGYISARIIKDIRTDLLLGMRIEGKEVLNEYGTYLGKAVGVSGADDTLIIQSIFEKRYPIPFSNVVSIGENIIVRGE